MALIQYEGETTKTRFYFFSFDASKINTNGGRIEMERLAEINNNLLKHKLLSNKDELLQECKACILESYKEADVDTNLEVKISWALERIKTIKDLIKPEFLFLWNISSTCHEEFTCEIKILSNIVDIFSNSNDFKLFQNHLRKYCKEQNLKMPTVMKDVRIMLTGKSEGAPIKEIVDLVGKDSCLQRMKLSLS